MQKHQQDLKQYSEHANNVLAWLQTINKSTKPSPRHHLQQQIQSLSLSYKNAQQKLLSLQKQIYYQSLHNQKQRSIIEILKYIINGNLDDDTILTYLVQMQDQANVSGGNNGTGEDGKNKYQIKRQLQQIKQMVLKKKLDGKKAESLKSGAISDLKKQIVKCNQIKKQLMQDLDQTLNQKGSLQSQVQQLKIQLKTQTQSNKNLSLQIQQLKKQQQKLTSQNKLKQEQFIKMKSTLQENEQFITKIRSQLNKIIKLSQDKQQQPKDVMKIITKLQDKLQKYRNMCKQLSQKVKKNTQNNQVVSVLKIFLPEDALRVYDQYQKNGQKCLLKQMQGIARLQHKKYSQLQGCQQQVWRLKQKLLREGTWLKSRKTGATNSQNKQNSNPNIKAQEKVSQFQIQSIEGIKPNQF